MPDEPESLRIACERMAREKEERSGFLDLGELGLQTWPEELWELGPLTGLNLGLGWYENGQWRASQPVWAQTSQPLMGDGRPVS
ncbi:MAG: Leucinerich repeat protein [Verrucomicrobiales bacterium]|nr:Leucinerich repeat protein [Verrucomicrobiales bacterium]